jgi:hypothetical protein
VREVGDALRKVYSKIKKHLMHFDWAREYEQDFLQGVAGRIFQT